MENEGCSAITHAKDFIQKGNISVFPNPAHSEITLLSSHNLSASTLSILDQTGRVVSNLGPTRNQTNISIEGLKSGLYFIRIVESDDRISIMKFVKI